MSSNLAGRAISHSIKLSSKNVNGTAAYGFEISARDDTPITTQSAILQISVLAVGRGAGIFYEAEQASVAERAEKGGKMFRQ